MRRLLSLRLVLVIGFLFIGLGTAAPARADIAPPEPGVGSTLFPDGESTQVRMVAETVVIEVAPKSSNPAGEATITATFQMRNLGQSEESMSVRFPLCASLGGGYPSEEIEFPRFDTMDLYAAYPPIRKFSAWVNERTVPVTTTYGTIIDYSHSDAEGKPEEIQTPCWANFPVRFPPGKEVTVRVRYTQLGYAGYSHGDVTNYIQFTYYLFTGAGWKDTIGSADITVKLPMEANSTTVMSTFPEGATRTGKEIRWHFEELEPRNVYDDREPGMVLVGLLHPSIWDQIARAQKQVDASPKSDEAWGQLGKAYKAAVKLERGLREDEEGRRMYRLSREAYQKAVDLDSKDADWHFGYADLVCWRAMWSYDAVGYEEDYALCVQQLQQTLALKPKHARALALIEELSYWDLVDISGPTPLFRTITPRPTTMATATPAPTATRTPTLKPSHGAANRSKPSSTTTPKPTKPATPSASGLHPDGGAPGEQNLFWAVALLPGLAAGWKFARRSTNG